MKTENLHRTSDKPLSEKENAITIPPQNIPTGNKIKLYELIVKKHDRLMGLIRRYNESVAEGCSDGSLEYALDKIIHFNEQKGPLYGKEYDDMILEQAKRITEQRERRTQTGAH